MLIIFNIINKITELCCLPCVVTLPRVAGIPESGIWQPVNVERWIERCSGKLSRLFLSSSAFLFIKKKKLLLILDCWLATLLPAHLCRRLFVSVNHLNLGLNGFFLSFYSRSHSLSLSLSLTDCSPSFPITATTIATAEPKLNRLLLL